MKVEEDSWVGAPMYWQKLVEIYSDKLKFNPRSHLYVPLADALLNLGRTSDALFALEDGLSVFPRSRSAKIMMAQISYGKGEYDAAKKILEEVVLFWPDAWAAVTLLCKIYDREGEREAALDISLKLLDYMPDFVLAKDLVARYNGDMPTAIKLEDIRLEPVSYASDIEEAEGYDEYSDVSIFKKVKTMAKLETLLYRIDLLKTQN